MTINNIFGAGEQGPYKLELVPGDEPTVSVSSDKGSKKRVLIIGDDSAPVRDDISGDTSLYVITADEGKALLKTSFKNGVKTTILRPTLFKEN